MTGPACRHPFVGDGDRCQHKSPAGAAYAAVGGQVCLGERSDHPAPEVVLEGAETAAVIEALGHYRDLLRAEGKTGAAYVAALGKICSFVTPASDKIILSAP